jgi:hypothetical protein
MCAVAVLILAAALAYSLATRIREDSMGATVSRISSFEVALDLHQVTHGTRLTLEDGLAALTSEMTKEVVNGTPRERPLLQTDTLTDAWGTPFKYIERPKAPRVISAGPDKLFGTLDDVDSTTKWKSLEQRQWEKREQPH